MVRWRSARSPRSALTLITSVRRRRRDLALLKTLGFTRRQLAGVVTWQATIAVTIGAIIGIPLGVVLGRSLWDLFAREIHAVPEPTVPALTIALVALGALLLANIVAAIPGRQAAAYADRRTPPGGVTGLRSAVRLSWYRFRTTFTRRWGGLLAIVVLIGLLGGLAIGAVAGARRTQSSFPAYLARTDASSLTVGTALDVPGISNKAYDPALVAKIARLPHVEQVGDSTGVDPNIQILVPLHMRVGPGATPPEVTGSLDGEYTKLDRLTFTSGRPANPKSTDEVVASASTAQELGMHVGSVLPVGFFTNAQLQLPNCCGANGTGKLAPHVKVDLKLVGIAVFNTELIEDDIDRLGDNPLLLTPALTKQLVNCCSFYTNTSIKVAGGSRDVATVRAEIARAAPQLTHIGAFSSATYTSTAEEKAERAIEPESIALGVFGAIAALAVLLIAGQLIGRQIRRGSDERAVLRALGASPTATITDGLFGVMGALVVGALLAGAVALALSPLAPLGPVRRVEHASIAFDWAALGLGLAALIVVLSSIAVVIAYRQAPHQSRGAGNGRGAARGPRARRRTRGCRRPP